MKKILVLLVLLISFSFYGQSVIASGNVYISQGGNTDKAIKSNNYVILIFNKNNNTIAINLNGDNNTYKINSSNITNGGKTRTFILSSGLNITFSIFSKTDVVMFPWVPQVSTGHILVKLTANDKQLLGIY